QCAPCRRRRWGLPLTLSWPKASYHLSPGTFSAPWSTLPCAWSTWLPTQSHPSALAQAGNGDTLCKRRSGGAPVGTRATALAPGGRRALPRALGHRIAAPTAPASVDLILPAQANVQRALPFERLEPRGPPPT